MILYGGESIYSLTYSVEGRVGSAHVYELSQKDTEKVSSPSICLSLPILPILLKKHVSITLWSMWKVKTCSDASKEEACAAQARPAGRNFGMLREIFRHCMNQQDQFQAPPQSEIMRQVLGFDLLAMAHSPVFAFEHSAQLPPGARRSPRQASTATFYM